MPPRKLIESTVYIADCSNNAEEQFKLFSKIFSVKTFSATDDMQRIILFNNKILNIINDWSKYQLSILRVTKSELNKINKSELKENSGEAQNMLDVLTRAVECFQEDIIEPAFVKKIVLLSDLSITPADNILKGVICQLKDDLKTNKIWLYIIGPNVKIPLMKCQSDILQLTKTVAPKDATLEQEKNFLVLCELTDENCIVADIETGVNLLFSHKTEIKAPFSWYVSLAIGNDLKIPVVVCKSVRLCDTVKLQPKLKKGVEGATFRKAWFDVNTHEEVSSSDVLSCYSFHDTHVAFTEEQEENMSIKTFDKCLSVAVFTPVEEITPLYFKSGSIYSVQPDMRSRGADDTGFHLFVKGLRVKNVVALAKRVYYNGKSPKLFCIFPCREHKTKSCLLMAEMASAHEYNERFNRGKSVKIQTDDTELKSYVYGYLDNMTDGADGQLLHPLPEHMKLSESRVRQCEWLTLKSLNEDPGEPPELLPKPELVTASKDYGIFLEEYCKIKSKK